MARGDAKKAFKDAEKDWERVVKNADLERRFKQEQEKATMKLLERQFQETQRDNQFKRYTEQEKLNLTKRDADNKMFEDRQKYLRTFDVDKGNMSRDLYNELYMTPEQKTWSDRNALERDKNTVDLFKAMSPEDDPMNPQTFDQKLKNFEAFQKTRNMGQNQGQGINGSSWSYGGEQGGTVTRDGQKFNVSFGQDGAIWEKQPTASDKFQPMPNGEQRGTPAIANTNPMQPQAKTSSMDTNKPPANYGAMGYALNPTQKLPSGFPTKPNPPSDFIRDRIGLLDNTQTPKTESVKPVTSPKLKTPEQVAKLSTGYTDARKRIDEEKKKRISAITSTKTSF